MKITTEQYKSFNNEFKDLISKFFNIHVEDNTAFYAWYSKKRNELINDIETYQFIQQFRKKESA